MADAEGWLFSKYLHQTVLVSQELGDIFFPVLSRMFSVIKIYSYQNGYLLRRRWLWLVLCTDFANMVLKFWPVQTYTFDD